MIINDILDENIYQKLILQKNHGSLSGET